MRFSPVIFIALLLLHVYLGKRKTKCWIRVQVDDDDYYDGPDEDSDYATDDSNGMYSLSPSHSVLSYPPINHSHKLAPEKHMDEWLGLE